MTKKIFALVMVISVLGSIFVAGCKKGDDADATTTGTTATTGATKDTGTTADTTKTTG